MVADREIESTQEFEPMQNYPNPFNASSLIQFTLPAPRHISLKIFNISGQVMKIVIDQKLSTGFHIFIWNGQDEWGNPVTSGTYVYQLRSEKFQATRKMVLLR